MTITNKSNTGNDEPKYTICKYNIAKNEYSTHCVDEDKLLKLDTDPKYTAKYTYECGCCAPDIAKSNKYPGYCPDDILPTGVYTNEYDCTAATAVLCDGENLFDHNHKIAVCKFDSSKNKYDTKCVAFDKAPSIKDPNDTFTCGCCNSNLEYGSVPDYCL